MLRRIDWANNRIWELGLGETCCVVYTGGVARLVSASGRELDREVARRPGDYGCAIWMIVARLEWGLRRLLTGAEGA